MRHGWILAGLLLAAPTWAGLGTALPTVKSGNQLLSEIDLPGGYEGEVVLTFENPLGLTAASLDVTADVVDPEDAGLRTRLPADVFIPSDFPVLIKIEPAAGSVLTFTGQVKVEIVAENLDLAPNSPLRLFRARGPSSPFQEVSQSVGTGSYRAFAGGGNFSEFLIAADLRPLDRTINRKFNLLDTLLSDNAGDIDDTVENDLAALLDSAELAFQGGDLSQAVADLRQFVRTVVDNSGTGIADEWNPALAKESTAGKLRAGGASLAHSLKQKRSSAPVFTGAVQTEIDVDATHSLKATLLFDQAFDVDLDAFEFSADLIDPKDPALLARLPAGVSIPSDFPVLLHLNPGPGAAQAFRGEWSLEIETDNLEFLGDSPLRLFKAPDGGAFEDVTRSLGVGSYRAFAGGGNFSEFLIVSDLRPVDAVIAGKFDRIEDLLATHGGAITPAVLAQLEARIAQARADYDAGALDAAADGVETFRETVEDNSEEDIPSLWRSDGQRTNVAGLLSSAAQTLELSLTLKRRPLTADPADVNRDGVVDVQDVLFLIDQVFGGPAGP